MRRLRFFPTWQGGYRVEFGGAQIGHVERREISAGHFGTDRFWEATELDSEVDGVRIRGAVVGRRPTRRDAAALLVELYLQAIGEES